MLVMSKIIESDDLVTVYAYIEGNTSDEFIVSIDKKTMEIIECNREDALIYAGHVRYRIQKRLENNEKLPERDIVMWY